MNEFKGKPLYKVTFNPDDESIEGIDLISFVKDPAIMRKGVKLSQQMEFKIIEEKMRVIAPVLIPDLPIFRRDKDTGKEYYIVFDRQTIENLVSKFNKNIKQQALNVDHTSKIAPAYIFEDWIKEDEVYDKSTMYGFTDVPIGTYFIGSQITDKEFWENDVKKEGKYGFSIEGYLDLVLSSHFERYQSDTLKLEVIEGNVASSNVDSYRYNTVNKTLILTFNDGSKYKYFDIDPILFEDIVLGDASCITEGSNEYGSWYIGKNPSVGAAVYKLLVSKGIRYTEMNSNEFKLGLFDWVKNRNK